MTKYLKTQARWPRIGVVLVVTLIACAAVISRRQDAFTNAQFWAEDGSKWFVDAYRNGPLGALDLSFMGYFQTVSRLGPVAAAPFGVVYAPLIYNIVGLIVQIAPVPYFLSSRFDSVVPSFTARLAVCAVYILMPSTELNVDVTTAPFHLVVLAFLVIVAAEPKHWYSKVFDIVIVALCGLSGPFAYLLAPIALVWLIVRRRRFTAVLLAVLVATIPIQLSAALTSPRFHETLGASLHNLVLIGADRVILAGFFAEEGGTHVVLAGSPHGTLLSGLLCVLAIPLIVFAAMRAPYELRLFGLLAIGVMISGLAAPLISNTGNAWGIMAVTSAGERYFLLAQIAIVVTFLWAASRLSRQWMKASAWGLAGVAFAFGLINAWAYPPFTNYHWTQEARAITTSPPGTRLSLPIPPGGGWAIDITAR